MQHVLAVRFAQLAAGALTRAAPTLRGPSGRPRRVNLLRDGSQSRFRCLRCIDYVMLLLKLFRLRPHALVHAQIGL